MQTIILTYVNHFKRFYVQSFQELSVQYGLSQLEIDILLFLHNNPQCNTARDIVELRGFAKSNVSNAVESLRKQGYLRSEPDPNSRKMQRLILLPAKYEALKTLAERQAHCFAAVMNGFTCDERHLLLQFLQRVDDNILAALQDVESVRKD